jgi:hypothetical protein
MNCFRCGEEIKTPAGYICEVCLDQVDEVFEGEHTHEVGKLSPREAIVEMLNGKTLITENGDRVTWNKEECAFIFINYTKNYLCNFRNLSVEPKKNTRPMDTFECLAWVNSTESLGWLVSNKGENDEKWSDWDIPQRFKYTGYVAYRRAKILPDKSGIDESTVQGFMKEVEDAA